MTSSPSRAAAASADGQVSGTIQDGGWQGSVQGVAQGNRLDGTFTMSDGSSGRFVATTDGNQLTVDIGRPQPLVFTRYGAYAAQAGYPPQAGYAAQGEGAPQPGRPPAPPPSDAPTAKTVPAFAAKPATGAPVSDQYKGWEVKTPAGWKHGIKDGKLVFGSDTETGVIVVAFFDNVTFEQAAAAIDGQIRGLGATPVGSPRSATVPAGRALIAELSGTVDGATVQGRAVGVAGSSGMLVVLGFSVVDKFKTLRQRVGARLVDAVLQPGSRPGRPRVGMLPLIERRLGDLGRAHAPLRRRRPVQPERLRRGPQHGRERSVHWNVGVLADQRRRRHLRRAGQACPDELERRQHLGIRAGLRARRRRRAQERQDLVPALQLTGVSGHRRYAG